MSYVCPNVCTRGDQTGLPFMALLASDDDHFRKPNIDSFTYFETVHNGGVKIGTIVERC